jgi:hypothetical protein
MFTQATRDARKRLGLETIVGKKSTQMSALIYVNILATVMLPDFTCV